MNPVRLSYSEFQAALAVAGERFATLRRKFPALRGYLVLASGGRQGDLAGSPLDWVGGLPELFLENPAKEELAAMVRKLRKARKDPAAWAETGGERARELVVDAAFQVEIRFHHLDYTLIHALQGADEVDPDLTPRTPASIRIVLGTLARFAEEARTLPGGSK